MDQTQDSGPTVEVIDSLLLLPAEEHTVAKLGPIVSQAETEELNHVLVFGASALLQLSSYLLRQTVSASPTSGPKHCGQVPRKVWWL